MARTNAQRDALLDETVAKVDALAEQVEAPADPAPTDEPVDAPRAAPLFPYSRKAERVRRPDGKVVRRVVDQR